MLLDRVQHRGEGNKWAAVQVGDTVFLSVHMPNVKTEVAAATAQERVDGIERLLEEWRVSRKPWAFIVAGVDANVQLGREIEGFTGSEVFAEFGRKSK